MTIKTRPFDAAEFLNTPEMMRAYLADAFASGDAGEIADALGVIARARGMTELARQTGLNRQALYRSLSPQGDPALSSVLSVLTELGLTLAVGQVATDAAITERVRRRGARHDTIEDYTAAFVGQQKHHTNDDFPHEGRGGGSIAAKGRKVRTEASKILSGQVSVSARDDSKLGKVKRKARAKLAAAAIS